MLLEKIEFILKNLESKQEKIYGYDSMKMPLFIEATRSYAEKKKKTLQKLINVKNDVIEDKNIEKISKILNKLSDMVLNLSYMYNLIEKEIKENERILLVKKCLVYGYISKIYMEVKNNQNIKRRNSVLHVFSASL